jgi:hypothetical protein
MFVFFWQLAALMKALMPEALIPALASKVEEGTARATTARVYTALQQGMGCRGPWLSPMEFDVLMERLLADDAAAASGEALASDVTRPTAVDEEAASSADGTRIVRGRFYGTGASDGSILFHSVSIMAHLARLLAREEENKEGEVEGEGEGTTTVPSEFVSTSLMVAPGTDAVAIPPIVGRTSTDVTVQADTGIVTCTSSVWSGVVFDAPLRRTHNW